MAKNDWGMSVYPLVPGYAYCLFLSFSPLFFFWSLSFSFIIKKIVMMFHNSNKKEKKNCICPARGQDDIYKLFLRLLF